jgi:hypothetical protein
VPVGALATAVLVINNIRDRREDAATGKRTLAVRLGRRFAVAEFVGLVGGAYLVVLAVALWPPVSLWVALPVLSLPWAIRLIGTVRAGTDGAVLNPALEAMGRTGRDALHVTENGRLAGLVRWRDLSAQGAETALSAHLIRDVPTTAPDTHLYRLFSVCARGLPVAVCDSEGALIGALRPETVLAELSAEDDGAPRAAKAAAAAA